MKQRKELLLLLFIIAAFIITRSFTCFNDYFLLDDFDHIRDAKSLYAHAVIPFKGPNLSGNSACIPGGGYYILLSIPALLFDTPLAFDLYSTALMLCAAVFFLYTVRKHYGPPAMFIAASLLLFSPRIMMMESGTWNPYYAAMLSLVLAAMLLEVFSGKDNPVLLFLLLPLSALMAQLHFTAFFYLPLILAVYFLCFYRGRNKKYFWLGISGAALLYVPYLLSELGNHFQNTLAILSMGKSGSASFPVLSYLLLFPTLDIVLNGYMSEVSNFLGLVPWYAAWPAGAVYFASLILSVSAAVYSVAALFRIKKLNETDRGALIFFFLVIGGLIFGFTAFRIPSLPTHYYLPVYGFAFFPLLLLLRRLEGAPAIIDNIKYAPPVIFTAAGSALAIYYFLIVIGPSSLPRQYGYVNALLDDARGRPFQVRTEYKKVFYEITAKELLHREWNEKDGAPLKYIIDKKINLTNTGPADRIYGDDRMALYRIRG
jgi:hypothetical protein